MISFTQCFILVFFRKALNESFCYQIGRFTSFCTLCSRLELHFIPVEMVKLLMDRGADPKVRNFFGTSTHDALFEIENISTEITMLVYGKNAAKSRPKGGAKGSQKVSPVQPIKRPLDEVDSYFEKLPKLQVVRKLQKVYSNKKHLQKRLWVDFCCFLNLFLPKCLFYFWNFQKEC